MWYKQLKERYKWSSLWYGYVRCGKCNGIRTLKGACPSCNEELTTTTTYVTVDGRKRELPLASAGAEDRYEDYVYLQMLEREWTRPLTENDLFLDIFEGHRPTPRAVMLLIFWTYFESRIERLLREALWAVPDPVRDDLLKRYESIGSRLDRLYRLLFASSYFADLQALGFGHVAALLGNIQKSRNEFMHGSPNAISEQLVEELVSTLKDEHESWIAVFNLRATKKPLLRST